MPKRFIWTLTLALAASFAPHAWAQHGHGAGHGPPGLSTMPASHPSSSAAAKGSASASFASHVANNPNLSSRLQPLLPAGTTIQAAASGFKNQGQFISALHVSRNLNIPFSQLKGEMTGADRDSLGHAIQDLRPNLDSKTVKNNVKLAERQTKTDLEESGEIEN